MIHFITLLWLIISCFGRLSKPINVQWAVIICYRLSCSLRGRFDFKVPEIPTLFHVSGFYCKHCCTKTKIPQGIAFSGLSIREQTGRYASVGSTSGLALSVLKPGLCWAI